MKTRLIVVLGAVIFLSVYFINCNKAPECRIEKISKNNDKASVYTNLKEGEKIRVIEYDEQQRTVRSWTGYVDNEGKLEIKTGEMETANVLKCDYCK
jgi:hypothetical protein